MTSLQPGWSAHAAAVHTRVYGMACTAGCCSGLSPAHWGTALSPALSLSPRAPAGSEPFPSELTASALLMHTVLTAGTELQRGRQTSFIPVPRNSPIAIQDGQRWLGRLARTSAGSLSTFDGTHLVPWICMGWVLWSKPCPDPHPLLPALLILPFY